MSVAVLKASARWGYQLDLATGPWQEKDILDLDNGEDENVAPDLPHIREPGRYHFCNSKPDCTGCSLHCFSGWRGGQHASFPLLHLWHAQMSASVAGQLAIPWPAVVAETTRWRYEGKKNTQGQEHVKEISPDLPRADEWDGTIVERLLLQQEPDSWNLMPRLQVDGEPGFAPHASDGATCRSPHSSSAADDVLQEPQPAMQVQLFSVSPDPKDIQCTKCPLPAHGLPGWVTRGLCKNTIIIDLCLCIQRCTVQAIGRALGTMVLHNGSISQTRRRTMCLSSHRCFLFSCWSAWSGIMKTKEKGGWSFPALPPLNPPFSFSLCAREGFHTQSYSSFTVQNTKTSRTPPPPFHLVQTGQLI